MAELTFSKALAPFGKIGFRSRAPVTLWGDLRNALDHMTYSTRRLLFVQYARCCSYHDCKLAGLPTLAQSASARPIAAKLNSSIVLGWNSSLADGALPRVCGVHSRTRSW